MGGQLIFASNIFCKVGYKKGFLGIAVVWHKQKIGFAVESNGMESNGK